MTADTQTLREFQEALFERLRNASAEDPARSSRLAFEAGGRSWLMRLDDAQEVVGVAPVTVIPLARPWYRGLVNLRGNLLSVVDLGCLIEGRQTPMGTESRLVLLAERFRLSAALLVDRVIGLRSLDNYEASPAAKPPAIDWIIQSLLASDGRVWHELSIAALAQGSELSRTGA